jgi:hypothetical protein
MSEITSNISNVQGDETAVMLYGVENRTLVSLPIDRILVDPDNPNIRGRIVDTTDIQDSIREVGVREPIQVRFAPDEPGYFYLISGGRRLTAAKRAGMDKIPAIIDENLESESIRRMMLASHVRKDHPPIVIDDSGMVVGGDCWAVYHEVEAGTERQDVALLMGVPSDVAGAYYQLFNEHIEVKAKVASGDMAITVYSLIKHQPLEVKLFIANKNGKVSARWVRNVLKNWDEIAERLAAFEDHDAEPISADEMVKYVDMDKQAETKPAAHYLSEASVSIGKLVNIELSQTDLYMLDRLEIAVRRLRASYANT